MPNKKPVLYDDSEVGGGGGASLTTDPAFGSSTGTDVSLKEFVELGQVWQWRFSEERDRRYAEVSIEREKALRIKETADLAALQLAREIQTYKDEKANELREQISRERGTYVTQSEMRNLEDKIMATIKPVAEYVTSQQGAKQGTFDQRQLVGWAVGLFGTLTALYFAFN